MCIVDVCHPSTLNFTFHIKELRVYRSHLKSLKFSTSTVTYYLSSDSHTFSFHSILPVKIRTARIYVKVRRESSQTDPVYQSHEILGCPKGKEKKKSSDTLIKRKVYDNFLEDDNLIKNVVQERTKLT